MCSESGCLVCQSEAYSTRVRVVSETGGLVSESGKVVYASGRTQLRGVYVMNQLTSPDPKP